jgi:hypothetical protein
VKSFGFHTSDRLFVAELAHLLCKVEGGLAADFQNETFTYPSLVIRENTSMYFSSDPAVSAIVAQDAANAIRNGIQRKYGN